MRYISIMFQQAVKEFFVLHTVQLLRFYIVLTNNLHLLMYHSLMCVPMLINVSSAVVYYFLSFFVFLHLCCHCFLLLHHTSSFLHILLYNSFSVIYSPTPLLLILLRCMSDTMVTIQISLLINYVNACSYILCHTKFLTL
jgi:hypothetical protein